MPKKLPFTKEDYLKMLESKLLLTQSRPALPGLGEALGRRLTKLPKLPKV